MKRITLIILLPIMLASAALASTTPLYVQEIVSSSSGAMAKNALSIVKSSSIRFNFAEAFGFPALKQYSEEKVAEGMSDEEIDEMYTSLFINSELQDFEIEQALTKDAKLRAGVISSAFFASSILGAFTKQLGISTREEIEEYLQQSPQPISYAQFLAEIIQNAMSVATGLMMIFPAVDSPDKNLEELTNALSDIQMLKFDISYSDAYPNRIDKNNPIPTDSAFVFGATTSGIGGNAGDYLHRTNHVTPAAPINDSEKQFLTSIGITDEDVFTMMSTGLPRIIVNAVMSGSPILGNNPNMVGELDYAIVIDLIHESGSLIPLTVVPRIMFDQKQYNYFKRFLEEELEYLDITMAELISLLRHPEHPASLFQVLQLLHKDFSLVDITALEYETRDAIIISNAKSKDELFSELSYALDADPTITELNELIRSKGQLTLALLDKGYNLDEISPHFSPKRSFTTDNTELTGDRDE